MLTIKNITAKNFLSIGNQTQAVSFEKEHLTLVLGANMDLGGDDTGSRNGVGKTTMVNALSYALYGQALANIKKENLINNINGKHMLVTVEFEKNNVKYRIERGRKPNVLRLYINDVEQKSDKQEDEDEAQGDSRDTQKSIIELIGMSHTMFKHLLALNTYTEPFLSMRAADQREVIEQLLGITLLSEKAEKLREQIKETKDAIQLENAKIEAIKTANDNVQKSINSLVIKSNAWETKKETDIEKIAKAIMQLETVDINSELDAHKQLAAWAELHGKQSNLLKQKAGYEAALSQAEKTVLKYQKEIVSLSNKTCPQCDQKIHDHKHEEFQQEAEKNLSEAEQYLKTVREQIQLLDEELISINVSGLRPNTFYDTEAEALSHKNNLDSLERSLDAKINEKNPYMDQIEDLKKTAIQVISWDIVNELSSIKDHQEFLLKLLTNKDSFIRKKIIDQNLSYLNKRLTYYTDSLGLPHKVVFQNDLNVEITIFGQDLDFDNLSRGERNRLILSLSFAFRDVWENLYDSVNLLFIDELIDNGLDTVGVENTTAMLKKMARDRSKSIWVISHREELISKFNQILRVVKENGFTTFSDV